MSKLFVIRHAQVNVDFAIPAAEWKISEDGIQATRELALRDCWDEVHCIYHSPEPKAVATAQIISGVSGAPVEVLDDLRELRIPIIYPRGEFVRRVGAYLEGFRDPEFEDWDQATERIVRCARSIAQSAEGRSVAMVSHGRILAVLFSHLLQRRVTQREWLSIRFPDLSIVDLLTWTVENGFLSQLIDHGMAGT